jgi:hypothetical protein
MLQHIQHTHLLPLSFTHFCRVVLSQPSSYIPRVASSFPLIRPVCASLSLGQGQTLRVFFPSSPSIPRIPPFFEKAWKSSVTCIFMNWRLYLESFFCFSIFVLINEKAMEMRLMSMFFSFLFQVVGYPDAYQ